MTCSEKKGVERREGSREFVGCQEGHEGSALTGEWAGIREATEKPGLCLCRVLQERADKGVGNLVDKYF